MSHNIELPADWRQGYGMYPAGSADASAVYLREEKPHATLVRWDYRRDGFAVYRFFARTPSKYSQRTSYDSTPMAGTWFPDRTAPVFDDPIAAMVWLEVQGE